MKTFIQREESKNNPRRAEQKRSKKTRDQIMNAVVELIIRDGFASVTTVHIATQAGISRGAMQHHFSSKNELLLAVVDNLSERILGPLPPQAVKGAPIENQVEIIVDRYWKSFSDDLFPAVTDIWMGSRKDPKLFNRINNHLQSVFTSSASHWKQYFSQYEIPKKQLMLAHEILRSTIRGLALRRVFKEEKKTLISKTEKNAIKIFVLIILKGQL